MIDNPEEATYIIEWVTLDDLNNFMSSPACAEFLRNLPEKDSSGAPIESGSALRHLTLDNASSSSRFLILKHAVEAPKSEVEDRVTLTAFSVPGKGDEAWGNWRQSLKSAFSSFVPRGSEFL
ncbi:hypothetical protein C7999DRAFT_33517 [Corynascus novoguineensis]|uniref:Uncharacterized protein n=1 Tax=Corynascus novoguineensis TaxID=1126955 RepID=A0AAN7CPY0_9PEZI|nr:hypothetical protein C7999DRAFT_33517 [Corynascus novoguineensis]